ncbi:hypothetical protein Tco_0299161 [Tanacetum coccineum]
MPPRRMHRNVIDRLVANHVAAAIVKYEANRANAAEAATDGVGPTVAGGNIRGNTRGNAGGNVAPKVHRCTYNTLLACNPHTFNETEGIVGLSRWFEKLESVLQISKCANEDRVKYGVCTLHGRALTWSEVQKMKHELWNLTLKGDNIGLPKRIQGNVTSSKPATTHEAIRMAHSLMDQVVQAKAA